ncbi:outer membrane protein, cobalt-zinc-cadmium efflux system [Spirosomataceae bacterium TFI 002]|nr:outer membrane protein, cobalt-zinc-cadmium efflux system [Spirosomataceae bacterium TFI 002]
MKKCLTLLFITLSSGNAFCQQLLNIEQCEALFLQNNLDLIANKFSIENAKAFEIQSKIWDLPVASLDLNFINPQDKRVFDTGNRGQKGVAIEQLLYLGGKKKSEIDFAKSTISIAESEFEIILRNLKFELHLNFYTLLFNQLKAKNIEAKINNLDQLIGAYKIQSQKGNVPLKDLVRLQSMSINFKSDLASITSEILNQQEILKILTNTDLSINPEADEEKMLDELEQKVMPSEEYLAKQLLQNNPEFAMMNGIIKSNERFLDWQKKIDIPDLTAGLSYDQRGGAFGNQINMNFSMPLKLWSSNKGNIKIAEYEIEKSRVEKEKTELVLTSKLSSAYSDLKNQLAYYKSSISDKQDLELLYDGIFQNFQKSNISLIEFADFMESYHESSLYLIEIKKRLILSKETINYLVNDSIF